MEHTNPVMPHVNRPDRVFKFGAATERVPGRGACGRLVAGRAFRPSYGVSARPSSGLRVIRPESDTML